MKQRADAEERYEIEVEVEPERWVVIRRDVATREEALQRCREVREDDVARHAQDIKRGRAKKGSKATVREVRAVRYTREVV